MVLSGRVPHSLVRRTAGSYQVKSSSQNSVGPRGELGLVGEEVRVCSWARSSTRRILPEIVLGRSPNSSRRIRLYGATRSRQNAMMDWASSPDGDQSAASRT